MVYKNIIRYVSTLHNPSHGRKRRLTKYHVFFSEYLYVISKHMIKSTIPKEIKPKVSRKAYDGGAKKEYR